MGVNGLWSTIKPAADTSTNLLQLSTNAFDTTPGLRGIRVGIDASLWMFAVEIIEEISNAELVGPNMALRNLFFKCCDLMKCGCLPLFVFDGPDRPEKIGRRAGGSYQLRDLGRSFQKLLVLMGLEFRNAPGEAEAELAALSDRKKIDVILTDDVDTFVFANSATVIRNWSSTLTGNQGKGAGNVQNSSLPSSSSQQPAASSSQLSPPEASNSNLTSSQPQVNAIPGPKPNALKDLAIYRTSTIYQTVGLDRDGMVLFAILRGGDYDPTGFENIGPEIAAGLARGGYGTKLFDGLQKYGRNPTSLDQFLDSWREQVADELQTNPNNLFTSKRPALSKAFRADKNFPRLEIIGHYFSPNVSDERDWVDLNWDLEVDLEGLVYFMREHFEFRNGDILMYLRNRLFLGIVIRGMRKELLKEDSITSTSISSTPLDSNSISMLPTPTQVLQQITKIGNANSTSWVDSYRLVLLEVEFVKILDPIIASLPPLEPPSQRFNKEGEPIVSRPEKAREGELKDLTHWIPKSFMVGKSARRIIRRHEDGVALKEDGIRQKEETRVRKAEEKIEKFRLKLTNGTTSSSTSPNKSKSKSGAVSGSVNSRIGYTTGGEGRREANRCMMKELVTEMLNEEDSEDESRPLPAASKSSAMVLLKFASTKAFPSSTAKSNQSTSSSTFSQSSTSAVPSTSNLPKTYNLKRVKLPSPFLSSDDEQWQSRLPTQIPKSSKKNRNHLSASSTSKLREVIIISDSEDDQVVNKSTKDIFAINPPKRPAKTKSVIQGKGKGKEVKGKVTGGGEGKGKAVQVANDLEERKKVVYIVISDSD